jgi:hypothetical protein
VPFTRTEEGCPAQKHKSEGMISNQASSAFASRRQYGLFVALLCLGLALRMVADSMLSIISHVGGQGNYIDSHRNLDISIILVVIHQ